MARNFTYQALTLRLKPSGESNREAWFLTAEDGILKATVFGGPKSRLRSHVAPFHEGTLIIYHDPVRDSRKVSDFDVQSWRPGLRELWERAMAADAVAETILYSQGGGGNWSGALKLSGEVLDALSEADAASCQAIALYFFWHWAHILGVRPDPSAYESNNGQLLLAKIEKLPLSTFVELCPDAESLEQARVFSEAVLARVFGKKLSTWNEI